MDNPHALQTPEYGASSDRTAHAANDTDHDVNDSHVLKVSRAFYLDHLERFTTKRAPALLGIVGRHAYISAHDRHLSAFAEDADFYAKQPTGVSEDLAFHARRTLLVVGYARRASAA